MGMPVPFRWYQLAKQCLVVQGQPPVPHIPLSLPEILVVQILQVFHVKKMEKLAESLLRVKYPGGYDCTYWVLKLLVSHMHL